MFLFCFVTTNARLGVPNVSPCFLTARFKELTKDMAQAADPTMGVKPDERLSEKLSQQTTQALQTDIASIEDEYGD